MVESDYRFSVGTLVDTFQVAVLTFVIDISKKDPTLMI